MSFLKKNKKPYMTTAEDLRDRLRRHENVPKNIVIMDEGHVDLSGDLLFPVGATVSAPYATSADITGAEFARSFDFPEALDLEAPYCTAKYISANKAKRVNISTTRKLKEGSFEEAEEINAGATGAKILRVPKIYGYEPPKKKQGLTVSTALRFIHAYGLPAATIGASTAYAMSEHPQSFPATFSGVASAITLGIVNEVVREVGFFGGALAGGLLSRRDENVKHAITPQEKASAKSTMRGYAYAGAYVVGSAVLYAAAPKTLEFAKNKIVPLFADNGQAVHPVGQEYLARMEERNDTSLWHSYAVREGFQSKPAVS